MLAPDAEGSHYDVRRTVVAACLVLLGLRILMRWCTGRKFNSPATWSSTRETVFERSDCSVYYEAHTKPAFHTPEKVEICSHILVMTDAFWTSVTGPRGFPNAFPTGNRRHWKEPRGPRSFWHQPVDRKRGFSHGIPIEPIFFCWFTILTLLSFLQHLPFWLIIMP